MRKVISSLFSSLHKIIEEGGNALEGWLALPLNLNGKLDFGLADATQILDVVELSDQSDAATSDDGLSETHVVHTVVHQHLDIVHLDNLIPHIR